jgi:hypothetical protein
MDTYSQTRELIGAIASILGIIAYTLLITHYLPRSRVWARTISVLGTLKSRWEGHRIPAIPYSLRYEVPAIVVAGLLLNLAGWGMTSKNPNILYLDMAGTAATSFLLGPWWGAIVGIITPFVIAEVYPTDASTVLIPWMLVNVCGGVFWGLMARTDWFRRYVNAEPTNVIAETKAHLSFLFWFGVVGASVMAVAGTVVSIALRQDPSIFLRSPFFAERLQLEFITLHDRIQSMHSFRGSGIASLILRGLLRWAIATFSYVPDKTISAAVGLLTAKYVFPLYEFTLMKGANENCPSGDNWLTPTIGLVCYAALLPWNTSHSSPQRWLWYIPFLILGCACLFELFSGRDTSQRLIDDRTKRVNLYLAATTALPREQYFGAIVAAVFIASLAFTMGLALFGSVRNNGTIAFRFVGTVLTYCLAFYVLRVSARQWTSMLSYRQGRNRETV